MYIRKNNTRVLIAMSGGVDSSVAAALLVRQGYTVVGAFMKQWDEGEVQSSEFRVRSLCPWKHDRRDAMRVAAHLGIELITLDFEKEYKEWVMAYMFSEYEKGRTPNPDVLCNKYIKFGAWLDRAREMGFDYLATGHYAGLRTTDYGLQSRLKRQGPKSPMLGSGQAEGRLLMAKDTNKDQTYFLHQLSQQQLKHTLFPIGHLLKSEVRELARTFKLPTAEREESMGICFVGEVPMKEFLETQITRKPGKMTLADGTVMGEHDGLAFYTIGQRHLGIKNEELRMKNSETKPLFVVEKRFDTNELVVGFEDDPLLFKKEIIIENMHWISGQPPRFPLQCKVRLRHRQEMQEAVVRGRTTDLQTTDLQTTDDRRRTTACPEPGRGACPDPSIGDYGCEFTVPQRAVTPGQFAVLYKDNTCLGGGAIV